MSNIKTAMVGTPCQILAATKINRYEKQTGGSPIDVKIGLFCMENFSYSYLEKYLKSQGIELYEVKEFRIDENNNSEFEEYIFLFKKKDNNYYFVRVEDE